MIILRKFESYTKCPKCTATSGDLEMQWCTGGAPKGDCMELPEGYEHLHVHCAKCGYAWFSETADADDRRKGGGNGNSTSTTTVSPHSPPCVAEDLHIVSDD